jgi:hypothetical protein
MVRGQMSDLEKIEEWLSDGDTWVGGFENLALDSVDVCGRVLFPFSNVQWDNGVIGETRAPDTGFLIGWKYVLQIKSKDAKDIHDWLYYRGKYEIAAQKMD